MNIKAQSAVLVFITILAISSCTNEKSFISTATPTYITNPTITLTPTAAVTPTETPNPLPEWAQALPETTDVVISPSGDVSITNLSWLSKIGVSSDQYYIEFNLKSMEINAFEKDGESESETPFFQAVYSNEEKAWSEKFDIRFLILLARNACNPTDYVVYDEWLKNPEMQLNYTKINGYPSEVGNYVKNIFYTQMARHASVYERGFSYMYILIDGKNGCWGAYDDKGYFSYRKSDGQVVFFSVFHLSPEEENKLFFYPVP